jgi:hypothetical protein
MNISMLSSVSLASHNLFNLWYYKLKFSQVYYFRKCTVKRELKTCENFNSYALTIKLMQQTRNFVYRYLKMANSSLLASQTFHGLQCMAGHLLLQRSLLPGGIILQGVLLLQGSMSVFACHYGFVPIGVIGLVTPSSNRKESITSYSCFSLGWGLLLATGIGTMKVQGTSVLRLI